MTAPLLETTVSLTGAYANVALYANFVGLWGTTTTSGFVYNDWGLNLYYPQGAVGYTAYVWDKYFNTEKGSVNIMDESYFTPTDLTVTETGVRNALLTWTAAKQSNAEDIVYKVERSVAAHFQDDTQDTWTFEGFETLAEASPPAPIPIPPRCPSAAAMLTGSRLTASPARPARSHWLSVY